LIVSLIIPIVTVQTEIVNVYPAVSSTIEGDPQVHLPFVEAPLATKSAITETELLLYVYILITLILAIRLVLNLVALNRYRKGGELTFYGNTRVILRPDITQSFSFLRHIYTSQESYQKGDLPVEILEHEKAHIDQKHSCDILLIELAICLLWFNPVIYLIRKAIKLNHEFLADESVLSKRISTARYQQIIINYASQQRILQPTLASHLSFGETKKRIQIMVKTKNKQLNLFRQTTAIAVVLALVMLLGKTEIVAQQGTKLL
jgi:beta-lactamase regulating signal transducer with metallopeptidase domain